MAERLLFPEDHGVIEPEKDGFKVPYNKQPAKEKKLTTISKYRHL